MIFEEERQQKTSNEFAGFVNIEVFEVLEIIFLWLNFAF